MGRDLESRLEFLCFVAIGPFFKSIFFRNAGGGRRGGRSPCLLPLFLLPFVKEKKERHARFGVS